jgi:hypothetical protein
MSLSRFRCDKSGVAGLQARLINAHSTNSTRASIGSNGGRERARPGVAKRPTRPSSGAKPSGAR